MSLQIESLPKMDYCLSSASFSLSDDSEIVFFLAFKTENIMANLIDSGMIQNSLSSAQLTFYEASPILEVSLPSKEVEKAVEVFRSIFQNFDSALNEPEDSTDSEERDVSRSTSTPASEDEKGVNLKDSISCELPHGLFRPISFCELNI